jgi:hypothetical protein
MQHNAMHKVNSRVTLIALQFEMHEHPVRVNADPSTQRTEVAMANGILLTQ